MTRIGYALLFAVVWSVVPSSWESNEHGTCPHAQEGIVRTYRDHCYQFVSHEKYWTEARDYCLRNNGRLVKIADAATNSFITTTLNSLWWNNNGIWIGLHDRNMELQWQWTGDSAYDNEPVGDWTNWGRGHPKAFLHSARDCVRMVRENGQWKWHETFCASLKWHYRFICQYDVIRLEVPQFQAGNSPDPSNLAHSIEKQATSAATSVERTETTKLPPTAATSESDPEIRSSSVGYSQDSSTPESSRDGMVSTVEQDSEEEYELFMPAALMSHTGDDRHLSNERETQAWIGAALIGSCALVVLVFILLLYRRKRTKSEMVDPHANEIESKKKKMAKEGADQFSRACDSSNLYIDERTQRGIQLRQDHFTDVTTLDGYCPMNTDAHATSYTRLDAQSSAPGHNEIDAHEGQYENETSGMVAYDVPRPTNIYDVIPGQDDDEEAEKDNIYEELPDSPQLC